MVKQSKLFFFKKKKKNKNQKHEPRQTHVVNRVSRAVKRRPQDLCDRRGDKLHHQILRARAQHLGHNLRHQPDGRAWQQPQHCTRAAQHDTAHRAVLAHLDRVVGVLGERRQVDVLVGARDVLSVPRAAFAPVSGLVGDPCDFGGCGEFFF